METTMKRVLCMLSGMDSGGAETFLMKIYRSLDREKYQMDFCINVKRKCFYEDEILSLGGRIFRIPAKSENLKEFKKQLSNLVKSGGYKYVLRVCSNAISFMEIKIAKRAGAEICSVRSSNSSDGGSFKVRMLNALGKLLYGKYVDVKIAPSDLAARYTFGDRAYNKGEVSILRNAVDLDVFRYDGFAANEVREELGIDRNTLVVGHISRFMKQKNHAFLLRIFKEIKSRVDNAVLLLVGGNGDLEGQIREDINSLALSDSVVFAGIRSDIPRLLSAMDVFVFPSFYEGMPNTVIEAQATGLPCVISDTITREADITGLVEYLPLENPSNWAKIAVGAVREERMDTKASFMENGYDIDSVAKEFCRLVFGE